LGLKDLALQVADLRPSSVERSFRSLEFFRLLGHDFFAACLCVAFERGGCHR